MTVAARNNHPPVTDREHVRGGVRPPETARVLPIRPDIDDPTARTRAISRSPQPIKDDQPGKIRNFASTLSGETRDATAGSWLANDTPRPLRDIAHDLIHPPSKAAAIAGPLRLAVYALAYLMCACVDTNKRAAATFTLTVLSLLTAWAIAALAG